MPKLAPLPRPFKSTLRGLVTWSARHLGLILPLSLRQSLVSFVGRHKLPCGVEFAMGMLDDLRRRDPVTLHRFLWSNHLAHAERYEVPRKFGAHNINPTRHILFNQISDHLRARGLDPGKDISSVFEVGCSMGYLLRHLEENVFPSATTLHGLDIDAYAVEAGAAHLSSLQSRVKLFAADMEHAGDIMSGQAYDIVLCCGVLMYVDRSIAEKVVRAMFSHAGRLVGLICLAPHAGRTDGAFIHDMDLLVRNAGGNIVSSNWIGTSVSGSSPSHIILAEPAASAHFPLTP